MNALATESTEAAWAAYDAANARALRSQAQTYRLQAAAARACPFRSAERDAEHCEDMARKYDRMADELESPDLPPQLLADAYASVGIPQGPSA